MIVNDDDAGTTASEVAMTKNVGVVAPHEAIRFTTLLPTMTGVADAAKNEEG